MCTILNSEIIPHPFFQGFTLDAVVNNVKVVLAFKELMAFINVFMIHLFQDID